VNEPTSLRFARGTVQCTGEQFFEGSLIAL
jgi:hypothetical protein